MERPTKARPASSAVVSTVTRPTNRRITATGFASSGALPIHFTNA
jgi:hypothetical protein